MNLVKDTSKIANMTPLNSYVCNLVDVDLRNCDVDHLGDLNPEGTDRIIL